MAGRLAAAIAEAEPGAVLTGESDPNRLLGRPGQYVSAATVIDPRVPDERRGDPKSVDAGAKVEVFADEAAAETREQYVKQVTGSSPLFVEYSYRAGQVLLRVSGALPPGAAEQYRAALAPAAQP